MSSIRIKDASFIQLHIEKLILAFGVLVFVVGIFLFVMGNPFAVELNNQSFDDPADAVEVLKGQDAALEAGLTNTDPLPPIIIPNFREDFLAMIGQPINSGMQVASLSNPGLTDGAMYPDIPEPSRYAMVYPPVPKEITHVTGIDVLDTEFDPVVTKKYFDFWGKDEDDPGDFTMFVAAGEFDVYEWVERLKKDAEEEDAIKIPAGIWAQRFGIAGVVLLRETWDPEQGRWVDRQYVEPLPNQYRMLPDSEAPVDTNAALAEIALLREGQIELAQPELPWLQGFVQAIAPGGENAGVGVDGYLMQLDDENLGAAEKDILKKEEKIKQLEERRARRTERERPNRPDSRPPTRPDDFDAPRPGPSSNPERVDPIQRQIDNLREQIERLRPRAEKEALNRQKLLEEQRRREDERLRREALRSERDRSVFGAGQDPLADAGIAGMDLKEGSTLRVWAADPTMQPGETYRYKLLVSVINPLYAVPRLATDQLEENKQRAAILPTEDEIEEMAWIGPIKVEPEYHFFFTSAKENGASIDIYRRHGGDLVYQDFDGSPGDSVGSIVEVEGEFGNVREVDMRIGAVIVDVERTRDALSNGFVNRLVYMDENGTIHERIESLDKSSPARKELTQEYKDGSEKQLRPADNENPGDGEFVPGEFGPNFNDF
jgi:hypothetical protein